MLTHVLASNASASTTSSCFYDCETQDNGLFPIWIWANNPESLLVEPTTATLEKTVITVINTDNGITETVTSYPSGYTAPLSNSDGTAISVITFTRSDQMLTTTV